MSPAQPKRGVRVHVGSILHGYTGGAGVVDGDGQRVRDVLADLERRHPGLWFRIIDEQDRLRPHVKIYVAGKFVRDLDTPIEPGAELHVLQALSGG
jgi:hypothetical protein